MTIQCQCDHCGAALKVKDKLAGTEGKCPKCRKKIHIPDVSSDDSDDKVLGKAPTKPESDAPRKTAEEEEEDAIFGDDFFKLQETPPTPRYVPPPITDDDDEPVAKKPKKSKRSGTTTEADSASEPDGNAATIASSLLSKTGKRNRPDDYKEPDEDDAVGYDFSEINYLLLNRVLPGAGAAIIMFSFFYWLFSGMLGGGVELPELAELTGRVTHEGQGIAAQLVFLPNAGSNGSASGSSSIAIAAPDGTYETFYKDDIAGLVLGKHEVRINAGTLRVTREINVEAGHQVIDFELSE